MCAHTITITVNLLEKRLCSGCPCMHHSTCGLWFWDSETREHVWYKEITGELQEPSDTDSKLLIADGFCCFTKRPDACIDALK